MDEEEMLCVAAVLIIRKKRRRKLMQRKKRSIRVKKIFQDRKFYGIHILVDEMKISSRDEYFK